ncbi:MAG: bifunctional diaminohydroxyphosphoribosylaminopyrimidine deaminase/5-amino-6-(5-phosphoribosylamino)uracil reductase RibD [Paludibacteraceae bacterium]
MNKSDEKYMARCLQLAKLGEGYVSPNPMVGAVVVYNDRIIGEGYHHQFGEAHAEPTAISSVREQQLLEKSTLYVNLEPCSHYGKTPPCANLIISKKIKRVVIGCLDPNPKVSGNGVRILGEAGIEVVIGVLENESRKLNRRFICFQEKKRPYIILKWAQTRDGFMDGIRKNNSVSALKISNSITRQLTHKMRTENMAIMISTNTVLLDNPSLTVRYWPGKSPTRIAIDRNGIIPDNYNLKDGSIRTIIFTTKNSESKPNLEYIKFEESADNLPFILQKLYERNIHSVLVEGGSKLLTSFIRSGLWDETNVEISTKEIGEGVQAPTLTNADTQAETKIDNHLWKHYCKTPTPY